MKLGLDIHGVIDVYPQYYIAIAKVAFDEVHIITGHSITDKLIEELRSYSDNTNWWHSLVSIQDELLKVQEPIGINEFGRPYWSDVVWNSFKGIYCADNKIDLHFDDSEEYMEYFTTPVVIVK